MQMRTAVEIAPLAARSFKLLAQNTGKLVKDYLSGKVFNIRNFRDNAFVISALIQVLSRIVEANLTAKQTADTPEGPYRSMEAMKTTFREAMGFVLSYLVLRTFQRGTIDFFRNFLRVTHGVHAKPTMFNGIFKYLFSGKPAEQIKLYPTLRETLKGIGAEWRNFRHYGQTSLDLSGIRLDRFQQLCKEAVMPRHVLFDQANRMSQYKAIESWANFANRLSGFSPKVIAAMRPEEKLVAFFKWIPILCGTLPTLLLSGFGLEYFSQHYAESFFKKVARVMGKNPAASQLQPPAIDHAGPSDPSAHHLVQTAILPYAKGIAHNKTQPRGLFYGAATHPGFRPTPWPGSYSGGYGYGLGVSAPH